MPERTWIGTWWSRAKGHLEVLSSVFEPVVFPCILLGFLASVIGAGLLREFDLSEYAQYAHAALRSPLLTHLPREYPAPSLIVFVTPLLLPMSYAWAFAILAGGAVLVLVLAHTGSPIGTDVRSARRLLVYLACGTACILTARYDIFAAACAYLALRSAKQERWSAAWAWSSAGFALKLFPAALWPVLLVAEFRRQGRVSMRRALWPAASALLVFGFPMLLDRAAALNSLHYYFRRPPEFESLSSGLGLVFDWHGWQYVRSFHSLNVAGPLVSDLATVVTGLAVVGCAATWWAQAKGRLTLEASCLLTLTLVVLGGKVLSVQYLIWIVPFWALYALRTSWVIAALANTAIYPYVISASAVGFLHGRQLAISMTLLSLCRDALIIVGSALWLRHELAGTRRVHLAEGDRVELSAALPGAT